jgi:hypothetical protein
MPLLFLIPNLIKRMGPRVGAFHLEEPAVSKCWYLEYSMYSPLKADNERVEKYALRGENQEHL